MDVIQRLTEGPFLSLITTEIVRSEYRKGTADNEDNQQNNNLTIDRFERGLVEGLIPQQEINAALKNTQETDPQGNTKTKDHLTEKDIRAFLADIKLAADKAGIPSEPFKADFAAELRKAVDLAMGRSGRPPGSLPATSQP
jgi:hypothetical protein